MLSLFLWRYFSIEENVIELHNFTEESVTFWAFKRRGRRASLEGSFARIAVLPGGSITAVVSAVVSQTSVQFRVDKRLRSDRDRYVFDDGNGVRLRHLDGVRSGERNFHGNAVGNGHGAIYRDGDVLGDLDWVWLGHMDGVRSVDGYCVGHLDTERQWLSIFHYWSSEKFWC